MNENKSSILTEQDYYRLQKLLEVTRNEEVDQGLRRALSARLEESTVVFSEDVPDSAITLNSRFTLRDSRSGKQQEYKLVLPSKADTKKRRVSVMSAMGIALLGCGEGDRVDAGNKAYDVVQVNYQPEATPA